MAIVSKRSEPGKLRSALPMGTVSPFRSDVHLRLGDPVMGEPYSVRVVDGSYCPRARFALALAIEYVIRRNHRLSGCGRLPRLFTEGSHNDRPVRERFAALSGGGTYPPRLSDQPNGPRQGPPG